MSGHGTRQAQGEATRPSRKEGNGRQEQSFAAQYPPRVDETVGIRQEPQHQLFSPIPDCSWKVIFSRSSARRIGRANSKKCARVRQQKTFIGRTVVQKIYKIPWWWPNWLASTSFIQAESMLESKYIDPRYVHREVLDETPEPELPPCEEYVVLGIFGSKGNLLHEEVIYIGKSRSKHLYRGLRRLFRVPIFREITSFGLYKVCHTSPTECC